MIFAIISFFSYRYYRYYIYYKLVFIVYEAFCLMAFLALMLAYIGNSTEEQMAVMQSKDKRPLPWPMGVSFPTSHWLLLRLSADTVRQSACATGANRTDKV